MNTAITKQQKCIVTRSGAELWIDDANVPVLEQAIERGDRFVRVSSDLVNVAEIVGIYSPETMLAIVRHRNGQWRCESRTWHDRGKACACRPPADSERADQWAKLARECGKCMNGFLHHSELVRYCDCVRSLIGGVVA